ncbi:MAG: S1/P1 nuclease [Acidobacteriaceae bacterium]|nr:S1/P1 nuclease [Acidobacteriaceae bacterium]
MPSPAYCWWETGHQVVARIAVAHLTPAARSRIARVLNVLDTSQAVEDALAKAATWADETKAETGTGNWHFIDLTLQDDKSDIPLRCQDDNCAPARIRLFAARLSSKPPLDSRWSELDALRYVVHFVGDIHQPLHDISDADLGGNCERVNPPLDTAKNLHAVWDGAIVNALGHNDKALAAELEKEIDAMTPEAQHAVAAGDPDDWTWESHQIAVKDVYQYLHLPTEPILFPAGCKDAPVAITSTELQIGNAYIDEMAPVVRQQLVKAGLRLARLLNESL